MAGIFLVAILFWFGGLLNHWYGNDELAESTRIFRILQIVPRRDGLMSIKGIVLQISAYVMIVGGVLGNSLFMDQRLQVTYFSTCFLGVFVCSSMVVIIVEYIRKKKH